MEVECSHKGFDVLTGALDTLEALKQRLGDASPDKKYEQQRKRLLKAALNDDKAASEVRGGDGTLRPPPHQKEIFLDTHQLQSGHRP